MEYKRKIICNGKMEVTTKGEVFIIKEGKREPAPIHHTGKYKNYLMTSYFTDGKWRPIQVHRLIAMAFIPNYEDKPDINHKDGNPMNNAVENLEWVTPKENAQHAARTGLLKKKMKYCIYCKRNHFEKHVCKKSNLVQWAVMKALLMDRERLKKEVNQCLS